MKITYDNIIYSLQRAGGISVYWTELCSRSIKNITDVIFYEYPNDNIFSHIEDKVTKKESIFSYKIVRYLSFFKKLPKESIFHSSYYRITKQKDVCSITTVHDFTYEYYKKGVSKYIHSWQKNKAIKNSNGIICVSENTKKDLLKLYPYVREENVVVIYNGVSDLFFSYENAKNDLIVHFPEIKMPFLIYVGERGGYKNFSLVPGILKQDKKFALVIIGGGNLSRKEKKELRDVSYYHYLNIPTEKLNILYNNAFCLLYPSSYEGFGIPLVEAMRSGCPIVATKNSSIPEVVGSAGCLVDNISSKGFSEQILLLQDTSFREEKIREGFLQGKKFSWDKCFAETLDFYKKTYKKFYEKNNMSHSDKK